MSPIYDYRCPECNITIDVLRSFKDETSVRCSVCEHRMEKVPSIPSPPTGGSTPHFYPNRW
jgi:putative FmdB family regulatory protein